MKHEGRRPDIGICKFVDLAADPIEPPIKAMSTFNLFVEQESTIHDTN